MDRKEIEREKKRVRNRKTEKKLGGLNVKRNFFEMVQVVQVGCCIRC